MGTHASFNGWSLRLARKVPDNERVPSTAEFLGVARIVHPKGHFVGAPYGNLYFNPGEGYLAADIRPPRKD